MVVEITGTIINVANAKGTSNAGKEWTRTDIAVEEDGALYSEGANIAFFNKDEAGALQKGMRVKVFFNLKLNKSNTGDQYFTNLAGWKWEVLDTGETARLDNGPGVEEKDDLPF